MKKHSILGLAAASLFLLSGYHGCGEPHILDNNGFDLWCGDSLCYWSVDKGSVEKTPTWHANDYAVGLVGDAVAISQLSDITYLDVGCIKFSLLANIEPTATVNIEMDIYDDGIVDWRQPIPAAQWSPFTYLVKLPTRYEGIRFRITKAGSGSAAIAQVVVDSSGECNMPALTVRDQPDGASCLSGDECVSGACGEPQFPSESVGTCGGCVSDDDCGGTEVCGSETPIYPFLDLYQGCGAPARHALGERCVSDSECSTGICCGNICSTCCTGSECDVGEACGRREVEGDLQYWFSPRQCNPGLGGTNSGQPCLVHSDCASGTCNGTGEMKVCLFDGRLCASSTDCPDKLDCVTIGSAGGTCE